MSVLNKKPKTSNEDVKLGKDFFFTITNCDLKRKIANRIDKNIVIFNKHFCISFQFFKGNIKNQIIFVLKNQKWQREKQVIG